MKKLFLSLLITALFILTFAFAVSAKDVDIKINDVNGNSIVLPTVDDEGDALTWYRITEKPNDGIYFEYVDGNTTYYIVSVKTKVAAYVNDNYRVCYSYSGLKTGAWSGNIMAANIDGLTHADGKGPEYFDFIFEGTPICYVYFPASFLGLQGTSGNSLKSLFYGCGNLVGVDFEAGSKIETLYGNGFYNCKKLTYIKLPENLKTISAAAFVGINPTIVVPKSVTTYEVSNWSSPTVIFTGTAEDHAGWAYQPSKIEYVNHCDTYHNGAHQEGEAVDYIVGCKNCGEALYCINPEHNIEKTLTYESYGKAGTLSEKCIDCNLGAKKAMVPALFTFKGYSVDDDNTSVCVGYSINVESISLYKEINNSSVFEYGIAVAVASNVSDNEPLIVENGKTSVANQLVVQATMQMDIYSKLEVKIVGDFSENENIQLLMAAYVYNGKEIVYIQGNNQETTQDYEIKPITVAGLK